MTVNVDIVGITVTAVLAVMGFLLARTLNKIDTNQNLIFQRLTDIDTRLAHLEGEHESTSASCRQVLSRLEAYYQKQNT